MDGQGKSTDDHQLHLTIETKKKAATKRRRIALYRSIISHIVGIVTAIAELHLGEKVSLREERRR
jgi:hypothetical protein